MIFFVEGRTVIAMLFNDQFNHTLDAKGRLIIPTKYREALGDKFVVSKGMDDCLYIHANEDWQIFASKLTALPIIDDEVRDFARFFLAGATDVEVDKQGRILLPANLRKYAKLDKDVVLAGVGSRIEIWDQAAWESKEEATNIRKIAGGMKKLGVTI